VDYGRALGAGWDKHMSKKNRTGNREPRKPKQPKVAPTQAGSLSELVKSRAGSPTGTK
jgi:hypothetical protein